MSEVEHPVLEELSRVVEGWTEGRGDVPLRRWLSREVDSEGAPVRLTVPELHGALAMLAAARRRGTGWPEGCEERIRGLLRTGLRFARRDFQPALDDGAMGQSAKSQAAANIWRDWIRDGDYAQVLGPRSGEGKRSALDAALWSSWAASKRVLAVARSGGPSAADGAHFFMAIDHRDGPCRFELGNGESVWLGPGWGIANDEAPRARPRPRTIVHTPAADLFEWSYRAGALRVAHSALVLHDRNLAFLSVLLEAPARGPMANGATRWSLPSNVNTAPLKDCRALRLSAHGKSGGAQALPIGLPCLPYVTERGSFQVEGRELVLSQAGAGRRAWLPLLVSWDGTRHRKAPPNWRVLTVTEQGRIVSPHRAFAARLRWGRDEAYVVYRSFGPPAPRAFLGHQTHARLLVGRFTTEGVVEPIFQWD